MVVYTRRRHLLRMMRSDLLEPTQKISENSERLMDVPFNYHSLIVKKFGIVKREPLHLFFGKQDIRNHEDLQYIREMLNTYKFNSHIM